MRFRNMEAEKARAGIRSNKNFALFLGVSEGTVKNWISGKTEIPASKLVFLSNEWNCSVDYLLDRTPARK